MVMYLSSVSILRRPSWMFTNLRIMPLPCKVLSDKNVTFSLKNFLEISSLHYTFCLSAKYVILIEVGDEL